MKTYVIDVRYYIPASNDDELNRILDDMEIKDSEYFGGCDIVDTEETEDSIC